MFLQNAIDFLPILLKGAVITIEITACAFVLSSILGLALALLKVSRNRAASTFGSNQSCIGQATRIALDSGAWADQGATICSNRGEREGDRGPLEAGSVNKSGPPAVEAPCV